ncbi:hypothetical protein [Hymenobacter cellulosilyticus]|uniref:Uncharacterized protein n=1 Tax=Hymenobacter cellulosilyticus TaxID=2932248 RepID=A0A8T9QG97_9BACT|nr:hypothetical protein [Hymenobacter cellulosilyticus]UOQ74850.1 hypothetical protein MUN79_13845 [Hymenobacter cellulosilyticus]
MRALSPISTAAPHFLDSVASWWSHALILLSLLMMARATRAQLPEAEQLAFNESAGGGATAAYAGAVFAYDGGSRCAGTVGQLVPAWANGAQPGTFSASPAGLSIDSKTGVVDLARSRAGAYTITNTLAAGAAPVCRPARFWCCTRCLAPRSEPVGPPPLPPEAP